MRFTPIRKVTISAVLLIATATLSAQAAPQSPHITGIAHVDYFVNDLPKAIQFWHDFLGYDVADRYKNIASVKINDHQFIELHHERPTSPPGMMSGLTFAVNNIEVMRRYLRSMGHDIVSTKRMTDGDQVLQTRDPDGTLIGFEQSTPDGLEARTAGKFLPATRISTAIFHAGFIVGNTEKSVTFYRDILDFRETWRGSSNGTELSWINMHIPRDADYIELMLYNKVPGNYGSSNHTSLVVPDMQQAVDTLKSRAAAAGYMKPLEIHEGKNHKRQVNLYDPDGTRVELMEPNTVDGKPTPSSAAPPPPPAHD
jgi:catechol 2,3-dioxygenase-like lactoylglutathione lyase family enzyme